MTRTQRRKINAQNAQTSTGPKSDEGKARSRMNALKHGLTAEVLTLPDEDVEEIREERDAWTDALSPQSPDEANLVDLAATSAMRLKRYARAETAIVASQVRDAETDWDAETQLRVVDLENGLKNDPARAVVRLSAFGAGAALLLDRWLFLKAMIDEHGCLTSRAAVGEALALQGRRIDDLKNEPPSAFDFAMAAMSAVPKPHVAKEVEELCHHDMPELWHARHQAAAFPFEAARRKIRAVIDGKIASLSALKERFEERDALDRAESRVRALVPANTPRNQLMLRYQKSSESSLDRSIKTLLKLQTERRKQEIAEIEADYGQAEARETYERNEPDRPDEWAEKPFAKQLYMDDAGGIYRDPLPGTRPLGTPIGTPTGFEDVAETFLPFAVGG